MFRLNRNHIFLIGLTTAFLFAGIHILNFYLKSDFSKGVVTGWSGGSPVVQYTYNNQAHLFIGLENLNVEVGDVVDVIYDKGDPHNAAVFTFTGFFMRYFLFLILPMVVFTAFIYSWFEKNEYVVVNYKNKTGKTISKQKLLN